MSLLKHLKDLTQGKAKLGQRRSGQWPTVRKKYLAVHSQCAVCGGKKKLEVHHKMPFHMDTSKELDFQNLITLCEEDTDGVNCHLLFGHLGNFKSVNKVVVPDSAIWFKKISERPKGNK